MSNRLQTVYRAIGPRLVFKSALLIGALLGVGYLARDVDFEQLLALADPAAAGNGGERLRAMAVFLALGAAVTAVARSPSISTVECPSWWCVRRNGDWPRAMRSRTRSTAEASG